MIKNEAAKSSRSLAGLDTTIISFWASGPMEAAAAAKVSERLLTDEWHVLRWRQV